MLSSHGISNFPTAARSIYKGQETNHVIIHIFHLTLYLVCQFWGLPIQRQMKIWCHKYGQIGILLSDLVENIVGKGEIAHYEQFLLFPQCFHKLYSIDGSK